MKWRAMTLQSGQSYRDAQGHRVDVMRIGEPDANGICFIGTFRDNSRRMYRLDGTSPDSPSLVALWPADEPDRYFALKYDPDQKIYGIVPTAYADLGMLRQQQSAQYAIRLGRNEDDTPNNEIINLGG